MGNNGNNGSNGSNGKKKLIQQEKEKIMKLVENSPRVFGKENYYDEEAEKEVKEKIKGRLMSQAKRLLRGPGYFMKFVEEVISKDPDIAYAFVVGSFADDNNYKEIMNEYKPKDITEEEFSKIWVPKDIDIFIVYEDEKTPEDEVAYLRGMEKKAPAAKVDDDEKFGYEIDGISVEKFCGYVGSDYLKLKDMTKEQIAEFKKEYSRRHKFQVPTRAIKIYQKELPVPEKDGNDMVDYKQRSNADSNLEKIREITGYPKSLKEFMDNWTFYAKRAKALFKEEFELAAKEFEKYKEVYNAV